MKLIGRYFVHKDTLKREGSCILFKITAITVPIGTAEPQCKITWIHGGIETSTCYDLVKVERYIKERVWFLISRKNETLEKLRRTDYID